MITYQTENVRFPDIKRRDTTAWIRRVAATYGKKVGEVGYLFCDDEHILEVNRQYLGHDYYTDIITFDYDEGDTLNGDLVISLTPYAPMPNYSTRNTMRNCTASSSMAFCISAELTTRDPVNVRLWKLLRIKHLPCGRKNN